MGLLTNSAHGVWALTDAGAALLNDSSMDEHAKREWVRALWSEHATQLRSKKRRRKARKPAVSEDLGPADEPDWKEQLLDQNDVDAAGPFRAISTAPAAGGGL